MDTFDPIWSAPAPVLDRMRTKGRNSEWTEFLFCGLYCLVAFSFLVFFGFAALIRGETGYAGVIFTFAAATAVIYGGIWISGQFQLARHFVVALMAALCLFLFYTGGTGPIYYFVFPVVALFLQGIWTGSISVAGLLLVSLFIHETGLFGYDPTQYSFFFVSRIFTVYLIVSILSFLFALFREQAERDLLLSEEDLQAITFTDHITGLANRVFMEKLLAAEDSRARRYGNTYSVMVMQVDRYEDIRRRYGSVHANNILFKIAENLIPVIRAQDMPSHWEEDRFLVLLPETSMAQALLMGERVRAHMDKQKMTTGSVTVSIGISEMEESLSLTIEVAESNLALAGVENGNSVIGGKQPQAGNRRQSLSDLLKDLE